MSTTFVYKVRDGKGNLTNGQIDGDGTAMVAGKLRQMGYIVIDLKEKSLAQKDITMPFSNRIKTKDITIFSRQFATMVSAGLSLTRCLSILGEQTQQKALKAIVGEVLLDVEHGKALSDAMAKYPTAFPPIYINLVRAGETGGVLDTVLHRIAEHFEKESSIKGKIKSAMAYPIAMFTFSMLITFALITFVVPVFVNMFASLGGELPLPTRILLAASSFIRGYWFILIPAMIGLSYGLKYYSNTKGGRLKLDRIKLNLPVFGGLIQKMAVSRFSRTLGTLMASGVPILQALDVVADSSGNMVVAGAVRNARLSIKEGESISKPLSADKVFPPMVVQMIAVGEETGALDTMLGKIADFYDDEVSSMVDALTSIIEPLMILVMAGIVGCIIVSLYMPMFQIINLIK